MTPATQQQPNPTHGGESVTDWLLSFIGENSPTHLTILAADLEARREFGIKRYGSELKTHNGRSALTDLYQELLDACQYAAQDYLEKPETGRMLVLHGAIGLACMVKGEIERRGL